MVVAPWAELVEYEILINKIARNLSKIFCKDEGKIFIQGLNDN